MSKLHLRVVSPERTLLDEEVEEVVLPTVTGQIAILPHHMPLVAELTHGDIIVKTAGKSKVALVYGGFVYVKENGEVMILADSADHLHELNQTEIMKAKERAEKALDTAKDNKELIAVSEAELARITTQLRSLGRHSSLHSKHQHKPEKLNQ